MPLKIIYIIKLNIRSNLKLVVRYLNFCDDFIKARWLMAMNIQTIKSPTQIEIDF